MMMIMMMISYIYTNARARTQHPHNATSGARGKVTRAQISTRAGYIMKYIARRGVNDVDDEDAEDETVTQRASGLFILFKRIGERR